MPKTTAPESTAPDLSDLRAFCVVVDLGSITAAAKTLGETKGAVSRRLTRLERGLGVVLLRRSPRLVQATEDGAAFRARVGRALELLDDASTEARHAQSTPRGHLRVTAPTDVAVLAAPIVAGFIERHPEVTVEMIVAQAQLDFDAHQIDVALRGAAALRDSSLVAHRLETIETRLYASPGYLRAHGRPRGLDDLARHRVLAHRADRQPGTVMLGRRGEKLAAVRVRPSITSGDFEFLRSAAKAGAGVALLPSMVAAADVADGALTPVLREMIGFTGGIFLVHQGARVLPAKVRAFRDFVIEAFNARAKR